MAGIDILFLSKEDVGALDLITDFEEIRVTSKRPASRERFAEQMATQPGKPVVVKETAKATIRYAGIIFRKR